MEVTTVPASKGQLSLSVPSEEVNVALIRGALMSFFRHCKLDEGQREDLQILVGEAANNAVKHSIKPSVVECGARLKPDNLEIWIINPSNGFSRGASPCSESEESGRGCMLIERIVSDLCSSGLQARSKYDFHQEKGKTTFTFSLAL